MKGSVKGVETVYNGLNLCAEPEIVHRGAEYDHVGFLQMGPQYLGEIVFVYTGTFLMSKARTMLLEGRTVGETADALGFEYPQHFARMFKKHFGTPPSLFNGK